MNKNKNIKERKTTKKKKPLNMPFEGSTRSVTFFPTSSHVAPMSSAKKVVAKDPNEGLTELDILDPNWRANEIERE